MGSQSNIEWTDCTWNPVRGCSIVSKGCTNCYAMKQAHRFSGPGRAYEGLTKMTAGGPVWTGKIRLVPEVLEQPLRWRKPRRIFVNSMSDLFHPAVPDTFIIQIFAIMGIARHHTFQVLTKRPHRMFDMLNNQDLYLESLFIENVRGCAFDFSYQRYAEHTDEIDKIKWPPPNVWLGVSAEDQKAADERIPLLLQTPAAVRFISAEPLLGQLNFNVPFFFQNAPQPKDAPPRAKIDWVIAGGESGANRREMPLDALINIHEQTKANNIPLFVKQDSGLHPGLQGRIPDEIWERKEFP